MYPSHLSAPMGRANHPSIFNRLDAPGTGGHHSAYCLGGVRLFGRDKGPDVRELAARMGLPEADVEADMEAFEPSYRQFTVAKNSGGTRHIFAPTERLKRDRGTRAPRKC